MIDDIRINRWLKKYTFLAERNFWVKCAKVMSKWADSSVRGKYILVTNGWLKKCRFLSGPGVWSENGQENLKPHNKASESPRKDAIRTWKVQRKYRRTNSHRGKMEVSK